MAPFNVPCPPPFSRSLPCASHLVRLPSSSIDTWHTRILSPTTRFSLSRAKPNAIADNRHCLTPKRALRCHPSTAELILTYSLFPRLQPPTDSAGVLSGLCFIWVQPTWDSWQTSSSIIQPNSLWTEAVIQSLPPCLLPCRGTITGQHPHGNKRTSCIAATLCGKRTIPLLRWRAPCHHMADHPAHPLCFCLSASRSTFDCGPLQQSLDSNRTSPASRLPLHVCLPHIHSPVCYCCRECPSVRYP